MVTERGGKLRPRDICSLQQLTGPQPHRLPSIFHRQMLSRLQALIVYKRASNMVKLILKSWIASPNQHIRRDPFCSINKRTTERY